MTTQSVTIDGKVYVYGGVMTHKTVTAGFSFKERIALLFGKPVIVVSEIYFKNEVRPLVAKATGTVEPLIKPKPILKSYNMTEVKEDIPQTNGEVENPVEEVQPQDEGINAGPGDDTKEESATVPTEPVAGVPAPVEATPEEEPVKADDWLARVVVEEKDLTVKVDDLQAALHANRVPADQVHILKMQLSAMISYQQILQTRINAAG